MKKLAARPTIVVRPRVLPYLIKCVYRIGPLPRPIVVNQ